jgi:hypothetical protein
LPARTIGAVKISATASSGDQLRTFA